MKTLILKLFLFLLLLCKVCYSQSGWVNQSSGTSEHLNSVYFININTGWAAGDDGIIIKTTNGGTNWQTQTTNSVIQINSIVFKDANTGWAAGGDWDGNPLCQDLVVYLRTSNGGVIWQTIDNGYSNNHFNKFHELSYAGNSLYACTAGIDQSCFVTGGKIIKSIDFGNTWMPLNVYNQGYAYNSVFFLNSNLGWAAANFATDFPPMISLIVKTTNSGDTWDAVTVDSFYTMSVQPHTIRFLNENTGYVIYRGLKKTIDGGLAWNYTDSASTANISHFQFINPDSGWCVGYPARIIRTNNGGTNWTQQNSNTSSGLSKIFFVNALTGWIVGGDGTILKTITGGLTSLTNFALTIPSEFTLHQNYPNPFNPVTKIKFDIPSNVEGQTSNVKLVVYNDLGKEVLTLVNEKRSAGSYEVEFNGENLPSGIYFYELEAGNFTEVKRMILLK